MDPRFLELVRRGEEEDRIANLPQTEQEVAWVIENERRAQWDLQQQQSSQLSNVPSATSSTPSNGTSIPNQVQPLQQTSSLTVPKRKRWRFKLKRRDIT